MKKYLFLLFLTATVSDVFAQDYYTGKSTVTADGITFRVERKFDALWIYNQNNTREPFGALYYHDGSLADQKRLDRLIYLDVHRENEILTATFTKEEYAKLRTEHDDPLVVASIINPEGEVIEVYFFFDAKPALLALPPEKLALLERNIKKMDKWRVTEDGKKLKYTYTVWLIHFSHDLSYPDEVQPDYPAGGGI